MKKPIEELVGSDLPISTMTEEGHALLLEKIKNLSLKDIDSLLNELQLMISGDYVNENDKNKSHITKKAIKVVDFVIDCLLEERFERQNMGK